MTTVTEIKELLRDWIEDDSIDDIFMRYINLAIQECESTVNFAELYDEVVVTPDSDGIITEPALSREITAIYPDVASGYPNYKFEWRLQDINRNDGGLLAYSVYPTTPHVAIEAQYDVVGTNGATVAQGSGGPTDFFVAADVGKRFICANSPEIYKIISLDTTAGDGAYTIEVQPSFAAESSTTTVAYLNPPGTKKYKLKDKNNAAHTGDVKLCFQRRHPYVFSDECIVQIPCTQSVALLALQQSLMTNKYNVDSERLNTAVMMAKNRELDSHEYRTLHRKAADRTFGVRSVFNR